MARYSGLILRTVTLSERVTVEADCEEEAVLRLYQQAHALGDGDFHYSEWQDNDVRDVRKERA